MYASYEDQKHQTLVNILGTFLRQFITTAQQPFADEVAKKLHIIQHEGGKVGLDDNLALLKIQLHQLNRAFLCIDAVDELDPRVRQQLFGVLKELGTRNIRIFLTGRDYIESEVQRRFEIPEENKVMMTATQQDIEEFVRHKIKEDYDLDSEAMDEVLASDIVDSIIKMSQGM